MDAAHLQSGMDAQFKAALHAIAARADAAERDPQSLAPEVALLAKAGILTACLPVRDGGRGLATSPEASLTLFDVLRRIGRANLSLGRLFEGHVNAVKLVSLYGGATSIAEMSRVISEGGLLGVWGANGRKPLRYKAERGTYHLSGEKIFASGLGVVRLAVVTMHAAETTDAPPQLALIEVTEKRRQDAGHWDATGMRATMSGRFDFTDMRISEAQCLGEPGIYEREPHFEGGIWRYCAVHLGGVEALLLHWRETLLSRGRFDNSFQLSRYARAVSLNRAMASLLRETASKLPSDSVTDAPLIEKFVTAALLARQFSEEVCLEILALAEKSLGTSAFRPGPLERIRRDLSIYVRQAVPDEKLERAGRLLAKMEGAPSW